jgi:putative flippase GtrA
MKKNDIVAILILGEIVAIFLFLILRSLGFNAFPLGSLFVALPILALVGVYIAYLIGKKFLIVFQFAKYAIVGLANTAVDFGILNFLMWSSKTYEGKTIILFNVISFSIAAIHSYAWNKLWTFKAKEKTSIVGQFFQFVIVSLVGVLINSGIVYIIITWVKPLTGMEAWANIAKAVATVISLMWNFVGYKFIVFKKKDGEQFGNISQI